MLPMVKRRTLLFCLALLPFTPALAQAQSPDALTQTLIQHVVDVERAANQSDHSNWLYLEEVRKEKERTVQWVVATQHGEVRCAFSKNDKKVPEPEQHEAVQNYLHDPRAQKKQNAEDSHDGQQVDDLLKLLPVAFHWTQTSANGTDTVLHFEPNPDFHPPTREARVFAGMVGDLIFDNRQYRIVSMNGRLIHDVTFGGGLLGRLKQGSSFSLEQAQVGPSLWQLTTIHVKLDGNALLFKSVSLDEDDERSKFVQQPPDISLDQAGEVVLKQPE
jgi:hypothetical protein